MWVIRSLFGGRAAVVLGLWVAFVTQVDMSHWMRLHDAA
jgi:hypothetical protein